MPFLVKQVKWTKIIKEQSKIKKVNLLDILHYTLIRKNISSQVYMNCYQNLNM